MNLLFTFVLLIFCLSRATGQGVGIGTSDIGPSVMLELESTDKGLLVPRMTSIQRAAIPNPADGLLVFDTDRGSLYYRAPGSWIELAGLPIGSIVMWQGSIGNIPTGWALCNGQNGTPNLSSRFIVGYSPGNPDYSNIGNQGGASQITLTVDQIPSHGHNVNSDHTHSAIAADDHIHDYSYDYLPVINPTGLYVGGGTASLFTISHSFSIGVTSPHPGTLNVETASTGISVGNSGGNQPHENRPNYYVIAYIMKI
jgi:microcystin-dependent protein